ncbi:MAG: DUF1016 N-terminal domain-containing protein [Candidatus Omnitrophota bacterium]
MALVLVSKDAYQSLLKQIQKEISAGRKAVQHQQALTYWRVGRLISRNLLENQDRAGYGKQLFERLSESLQVDKNTLHQSVRFYETYPIVSARLQLEWSHYRKLISVDDKAKRRALERRAVRQNLSSRQLSYEIKNNQPVDLQSPIPRLTLQRGKLYTYRVAEPKGVEHRDGYIILDCGFDIFIRQKLRLKGVDAAEITTKTGRAAKRFLIAALKPCPFLIVKTYQPDKFDRYLVEVFYLPGEPDETKVAAEGKFLNQELLDNRLVGEWREE